MDIMELRKRIISQTEHIPLIGGLPVYIDNAFYPGSNGLVTQYGANSSYFLTGIVDTGTSDSKRYNTVRIGVASSLPVAGIRLFNDLNSTSVDYWTIMRPEMDDGTTSPYSFTSYGRFVILSVIKEYAANFYVQDGNGNYLLKGSNVH